MLFRSNRLNANLVNQHSCMVLIDDVAVYTTSLANNKFFGELPVSFSTALDFGPHTLKVQYTNTAGTGNLRIENIYVGAPASSGINCDSLLTRESTGNLTLKNNETYCLTFNSPFFYWALSKFPI